MKRVHLHVDVADDPHDDRKKGLEARSHQRLEIWFLYQAEGRLDACELFHHAAGSGDGGRRVE